MRLCHLFLLFLSTATSLGLEQEESIVTVDGEGRTCHNAICSSAHGVPAAPQDFSWDNMPCRDVRPYCVERKDTCQSNWKFMHAHCPETCQVCHNVTRAITVTPTLSPTTTLPTTTTTTLPTTTPPRMNGVQSDEIILDMAGADMGVAQLLDPTGTGEYRADIIQAIEDARDYVQHVVMVDKRYEKVREQCQNRVAHCAFFAVKGECENNPDWMEERCAPFCESCEIFHVQARCPMDRNAKHAWYPGDLNRMFERIITEPEIVERFQPKVLSRPTLAPEDIDADEVDYLIDGPWVVTLENFVSATEAQFFIDIGGEIGYKRSADVGEEMEDGSYDDSVNDGRTSENAWCEEDCKSHAITLDVMSRMEFITGIPTGNSESLQLLRYEVGQFCKFL